MATSPNQSPPSRIVRTISVPLGADVTMRTSPLTMPYQPGGWPPLVKTCVPARTLRRTTSSRSPPSVRSGRSRSSGCDRIFWRGSSLSTVFVSYLTDRARGACRYFPVPAEEIPMNGLMMQMPLLVSSILRHADRHHGDVQVVSRRIEGDIHRYTYRDAHARARRLAKALRTLGAKPGDRIGSLAWNGYRHL